MLSVMKSWHGSYGEYDTTPTGLGGCTPRRTDLALGLGRKDTGHRLLQVECAVACLCVGCTKK